MTLARRNRAANQEARQRAERNAARAWRSEKGVKLDSREVMLYSDDLRVALRARLDEGYPHQQGAFGGWVDEQLPGQTSATIFQGGPSPRLPLRLLLGGFPQPLAGRASTQIDTLYQLGGRDGEQRRGTAPPLLRVRGDVRHEGARWFIDDLVFLDGPDDTMRVNGTVVSARAVVTLRRYEAAEFVTVDGGARRSDGGAPRTYRVKKGDTAWTIARDEVKTKGSREARDAIRLFRWGAGSRRGQRIRDPRAIKAGDVITLPRRELRILSVGPLEYR